MHHSEDKLSDFLKQKKMLAVEKKNLSPKVGRKLSTLVSFEKIPRWRWIVVCGILSGWPFDVVDIATVNDDDGVNNVNDVNDDDDDDVNDDEASEF